MGNFWALWLAAHLLQPVSPGDVIEPGLYPADYLLRAYACLDGYEVVYDTEDLPGVLIGVGVTLPVARPEQQRMELLLRAGGVFLKPLDVRGKPAFLFASRDPAQNPPQELSYQVVVITLQHARVKEVESILSKEIEDTEKEWPEEVPRSRVVGDSRTSKLVLRCASSDQLQIYRAIATRLDQPDRPESKPALRSWVCRELMADDLAQTLADAWKARGGAPFKIVTHRRTNSLMIRLPLQYWPDVEALLIRLDKRK